MSFGKVGGYGGGQSENSSTPISMDIRDPGEAIGGPEITLPEFGQRQPGYQQPQGPAGGLLTPVFNQIGNRVSDAMFGPQQNNQQYYQQMHKSIDGMNEALKQIEGVNTPGGRYQGGGQFGGSGKDKGAALF